MAKYQTFAGVNKGVMLTDEEADYQVFISTWKYAEEIPEPVITEVTMDEIAEKFGISVEQLKIKNQKFECECGFIYRYSEKAAHFRSTIHMKFIETGEKYIKPKYNIQVD